MFCGALSHMHCWDCSGRWQWLQKRCTFSLLQSRPGQSVNLIKYSPTTSSTYTLSAGMLQPFAAVHTPAQASQFPATAPFSLAVWLCAAWLIVTLLAEALSMQLLFFPTPSNCGISLLTWATLEQENEMNMHAWRSGTEARTYFRDTVRPHESCAASDTSTCFLHSRSRSVSSLTGECFFVEADNR